MKEEEYIALIYKSLKGELSQAEELVLDNHTSSSEEQMLFRTEIEDAWFMSIATDALNIDVEADLLKTKAKLNTSSTIKSNQAKSIPLFRRLALAASVLLVAAIGFWVFNNKPAELSYASSAKAESFTLPDGSVVHLNKNSQLTLSKDFNKKQREVQLIGEGFFDVQKNGEAPFIINTAQTTVTVLGTSFNVKNSQDKCVVAVQTGKVSVKNATQEVILSSNEIAVHDFSKNQLNKLKMDSQNFSYWTNGSLVFKETKVEDALVQLSQIFDTNIELENEALNNCLISLVTNKRELVQILEKLSLTLSTKVQKIDNGSFILKGGSCQ